jgi:hypothetical protein
MALGRFPQKYFFNRKEEATQISPSRFLRYRRADCAVTVTVTMLCAVPCTSLLHAPNIWRTATKALRLAIFSRNFHTKTPLLAHYARQKQRV